MRSRFSLRNPSAGRFLAGFLAGMLLPPGLFAREPRMPEDQPCPVDEHHRYIVQHGDHLIVLALRCYGDPSLWRRIAELNSLSPPYFLGRGTLLLLPDEPRQIDLERSRELESAYWRNILESRDPISETEGRLAAPQPSKSERDARAELEAMSDNAADSLDARLHATQELLKDRPDLLSARISEIRLLSELGKRAEAARRAKRLLADHPELGAIPRLKEWSSPESGEAP